MRAPALLRAVGGRLRREARFLARLFWRHRKVVAVALGLNLTATLFESSTVGVLLVALKVLAEDSASEAAAALSFATPWIEAGWARLGKDGLFVALLGLAVVGQIAVSTAIFGGMTAAAVLQARVEGDLRSRIFRRLMSLPYAEVRAHRVGDLASLNDQVNYIGHVVQLLNIIASQLLMMAAYASLLFWLSWPMTLVALAGAALLFTLLRKVVRRIHTLGEQFTAASVALAARTVEYLNGIRLVRILGRESYAIAQVDRAVNDSVGFRRRALTWNATIGPTADVISILGVALFLIGGLLVLGDRASEALPRLATFLFVLYRLMPRIKSVNQRLGHVSNYLPFVARAEAILRRSPADDAPRGTTPFSGLRDGIEFRQVSLRYGEDEPWAVEELSFQIPRGSMVALVGESGAGKSTIADLLVGLYRPTDGLILADGVDLATLDWHDWRRHIGVVSQEAFLLHASVRGNIAFGRLDADDEEIRAAAQAASAHDFILSLPNGYDTIIGEQGYRLSGGQRQRLAIARALLREPEILILDEATSQLDSESERRIQQALKRLRAERTVLVIAHRLSTLTDADDILVLERGRVKERGSHTELLAKEGAYGRLWELQSKAGGPAANRPTPARDPAR